MKNFKLTVFFVVFGLILATGCSNQRQQGVDLDRVLKIMSATLTGVEQQSSAYNEDEIMTVFITQFRLDINQANPKLHPQTIGATLQDDGSVLGYNDKNSNANQDTGESQLFKVEIDGTNNRLIASEGSQVRERSFSGSGFLMGMLIGNMLSRQRTAGVNTNSLSNKKVTAKQTSTKKTTSARSRSRSGSYSRGK
ncbi:MAG: hypothetical protein JKY19_14360 [Alcanivoracaceae bacterium]|nr:hypothetical protein [Alcanivoracaceae bacterium]